MLFRSKAIKARQAIGIDAVIKRLTELKGVASAVPVATPSSTPTPAATTAAATLDEAWAYAVEHLGKVTPLARSCLVGTKPLGIEAGVLRVGFDPEFADRMEFVTHARNLEVLIAKMKEKLRRDVTIKFEPLEGAAPAAPRPAPKPVIREQPVASAPPPPPPKPSKKNLDEFRNDPLIKKALEIFKGTIVEVRK